MVLESKYQDKEIYKIVDGTEIRLYTVFIIITFIETMIDEFKHFQGHVTWMSQAISKNHSR